MKNIHFISSFPEPVSKTVYRKLLDQKYQWKYVVGLLKKSAISYENLCQFKYKSFDFFKIIYLLFGCAVPLEVKEWGPNH